jgi:hypothetical protein
MPLPNLGGLAEHTQCPCRAQAPDEGHVARRRREPLRRHYEARGRVPQPHAPAVLHGHPVPEPRRTRGALKPLRFRTRLTVRPKGSGYTTTAFSSEWIAAAPIKQ